MTFPGAKWVALVAALTLSMISAVARAQDAAADPDAYAPPEAGRRNTGRMVTGIVLSATAGANILGGGALVIGSVVACHDEYCAFATIGGAATMTLGAILAAIGIPLWVSGARPASPGEEGWTAMPRLAVGPKRVMLAFGF